MLHPDIYLSIIIPAYNEAERLPQTLKRLHEYLTASGFTYEILVVLDGPSDGTREVLQKLLCEIPHLKMIDHPVNRGKGLPSEKGCSGRRVAYVSSLMATIRRTLPISTK